MNQLYLITKTTSPFVNDYLTNFKPLPDDKKFRLVQIETNCRRHFNPFPNDKF